MTADSGRHALVASATAFAFACSAQTPPTADPAAAAPLGVVVVTGSQPSSLPTHIAATVESQTGRAVIEKINATDAEDALKYMPSLLVRKRYAGDYNHAVLSTRASGTGNSARSLVYADGILLSNLLGNGAAYAPRWGLVTPEEIERVDVLYGPFSAAYPGNSVGAVVDFVTRLPTTFEGHAKATVFRQPFDLYGTHDTYTGQQTSASLGACSGAWSWWLALNRLDSESQPLVFATRLVSDGETGTDVAPVDGAQTGLNRANQPWYLLGTSAQMATRQDHAKLRVALDLQEGLRASYLLGHWHNRAQGRSATYLHDAQGKPVFAGPFAVDGRAYRAASGARAALSASDFPLTDEDLAHRMQAVSLKRFGSPAFNGELSWSRYDYAQDRLRRAGEALPAAAAGGAGTLTDQHGTGWDSLNLKGSLRLGERHRLDLGLQQDTQTLATQGFRTSQWLSGAPGSLQSAFRGRTRLRSAWAQDTWDPLPTWWAVLGLRLEHWQARDGVTASSTAAVGHPARGQRQVSPKAALAHALNDDWMLKASLGRAVRMPTVSELYQGSIGTDGMLQNGNPDLRPERSWTSEWTAEWTGDTQRLRSTVFIERTQDALYTQTNVTVAPTVTNVQNVGVIRTRGVEWAWQQQRWFVDSLTADASLTHADSRVLRNDAFPASVGRWQPRVPQWRGHLSSTWRPSSDWSVTAALRYSGRQFSTLDNSDPNGAAYQGSSAMRIADLRVLHRLDRQWRLALGVDNLGNQQVWNFHPYPQRTWSTELAVDL